MRYHPGRGERAKVGEHELDLFCEAMQRGIMAREGETRGGCIKRNDFLGQGRVKSEWEFSKENQSKRL